jgi:CheY-like chemotaxis protein
MILLVEDEAAIRQSMREVLEDEGYPVAEAANGQEALDFLRSHETVPCLVLLDLMMPVMSGFDFLDIVKDDPALSAVSILIVSAAAKDRIDQAFKTSRAVGVIPKPVQLKPLLKAVEQYC